jgi:uncharacterized lipoprotein YddW (UPF0748 family)
MRFAALLSMPALALAQGSAPDPLQPPEIPREFRGVWVATVNNIDWPSRRDLTTDEQQRELVAILDRAAAIKLNAIVFQVRPEADALYASTLEPWSRYLTGRQGRAPAPPWDPLAFAVREAHKRGLELHAWFNPYRLAFQRDSAASRTHVSRRRPDLVRPYGRFLWLDPGLAESRRMMTRVVLDVVRRYDVDGVHIDDYFYPYPESRAGERIEFPDARTYAAYQRAGGKLEKADWRRRNVDLLVREFYHAVKAEKRWVKVGISPFGVWRPGFPATTTAGLDQYDELYADVRKWLNEGTLDYLAPQLYWPVYPPEQSYPVLLKWWVEESHKGRHVWPGLADYKLPIAGPRKMSADDIIQEIGLTRIQPGATGHIHFNARVLMDNVEGISDLLAATYGEPALVPAFPWLDSIAPARPIARVARDSASGRPLLRVRPGDAQRLAWWVVQSRAGGVWSTTLVPATATTHILDDPENAVDVVSVAALDRAGNLSARVVTRVDRR